MKPRPTSHFPLLRTQRATTCAANVRSGNSITLSVRHGDLSHSQRKTSALYQQQLPRFPRGAKREGKEREGVRLVFLYTPRWQWLRIQKNEGARALYQSGRNLEQNGENEGGRERERNSLGQGVSRWIDDNKRTQVKLRRRLQNWETESQPRHRPVLTGASWAFRSCSLLLPLRPGPARSWPRSRSCRALVLFPRDPTPHFIVPAL